MNHIKYILLIVAVSLGMQLMAQCYELVWSDEFNYSGAPDPSKWTHEVNGDGGGNNELQYYTDRLQNSRVEDSVLVIEAHKETYMGKQYTSARLNTYNKASFKYGKMEARIKLPFGQGMWPAFWMLGDNIFSGTGWPACGEVDIMEMIGGNHRDNEVHGTLHWSNTDGSHASEGLGTKLSSGIFNDDFHLFTAEWDETSIRIFLDGVQYFVINTTAPQMSEFHKNFFLILNLAVGGNWPGNPDASTQFPQQMLVDYVRVYQKNGIPSITGPLKVVKGQKKVGFSVLKQDGYAYNWTVPQGAEIISGQGTEQINVDWGCTADTVKCEWVGACTTHHLSYFVGLDKLQMEGKTLVKAYEKNVSFGVPASKNTTYQWTFPEGVVLPETEHANTVLVDWGNQSGLVKVISTNACGTDSAQLHVKAVAKLPYGGTAQVIPGSIQSVHFDTGGEGIAYHDTDKGNNGPGIRQDEDVDTEYGDGTGNIGWTKGGEWLEYTIKVEETGTYDLQCRTAALTRGGKFRILINGVDKTGEKEALSGNSWTTFRSLYIRGMKLAVTDTVLRLEIMNGEFNMANMNFTKVGGSPVIDIKKKPILSLYPSVVHTHIHINNLNSAGKFSIVSLSGTQVKSGRVLANESIDARDIEPGIYLLIVQDRGANTCLKFTKIN